MQPQFNPPDFLRTPGVLCSVLVKDIAANKNLVSYAPQQQLRSASVGKIFLLTAMARAFETGQLNPMETLTPAPDSVIAESGLAYLFAVKTFSLADLCLLIGAVSDNCATNMLLRRIGLETVRAVSEELGYRKTFLEDFVRLDRAPTDQRTLSRGNAVELVDLMIRVHSGTLFTPTVSAQVRGWLSANMDQSMVGGAFNLDPLAHRDPDRGVRLFNKTGTISEARADVGCVTYAGPGGTRAVAYAYLAEWDGNVHPDPRDAVLDSMRQTGLFIRSEVGAT